MEKIKLVVLEEHTLGYITELLPNYVSVLSGSVLRGSPYSIMNNCALIGNKKVRLATEKDFDDFRVNFEQYKNKSKYDDTEYIYDKCG
jgi:hypothetical protein